MAELSKIETKRIDLPSPLRCLTHCTLKSFRMHLFYSRCGIFNMACIIIYITY
jgi:hypothetical protein